MTPFAHLFSPLAIGARQAPNRIVSTAHQSRLDEDGHIAYHAAKLLGGAGTDVVFATTAVHPTSNASDDGSVAGHDESCVGVFTRTVRALREASADALLICQLTHRGRRSRPDSGPWLPALAPSPVGDEIYAVTPRAMDGADVDEIVAAFAAAADRVRRGGFDGVEILAAYGHLVDQFWSPSANVREDELGIGEGTRFALMVLDAVRGAVGPDLVIGVKLTGDDLLDGGVGREQALAIAGALAASGHVDYLNVIGGTGEERVARARSIPGIEQPHGVYADLAAGVRAATGLPVTLTGRVVHPDHAEALLDAGACDQVSMTRALMADPQLPAKARHGEISRIRLCTGCNEGCIGRNYEGRSVVCIQNPVLTRERELAAGPALAAPPRRVVVVGGGPAGLEAARTAAERGHAVTLLERGARTGGRVVLAARAPYRAEYLENVAWLERELARLGIDVRTGVAADAGSVRALAPDVVVVAVGGRPRRPAVTGVGAPHVRDVEDVMAGDPPRGHVVIVDEDRYAKALSAADHCAAAGARVTLVTRWYFAGDLLPDMVRAPIYGRLEQAGVTMVPNRTLAAVDGGDVVLRSVFGAPALRVEADAVVLSYALAPDTALADELAAAGVEVVAIGDCLAPRGVAEAILEATRTARAL